MTSNLIGKRLRVLREARGLDQDAIAAMMGFNNRQTVSTIENGERKVKAEELVTLVEGLNVGLDYFTDPFRLDGEARFSWRRKVNLPTDTLESYERIAGRWIAAFRVLAPQVGKGVPVIRPQLPLIRDSSHEDAMAAGEAFAVEYALGDVPGARLPVVMEERLGILVLMVDTLNGISGASCALPDLGAVLINRREVRGRRNFDLAHELFHILTWDKMPPERSEEAGGGGRKPHVEKLADAFASAVLMPRAVLADVEWQALDQPKLVETMNRRATLLGATSEALRWRLASLRMLPQSSVRAIPSAALRNNGYVELNEPEAPPLFSRRFMEVVAEAVDQGRLSARRAAALLGVDLEGLGSLLAAHGIDAPFAL